MKLSITVDDWEKAPENVKNLITIWKTRKKYPLDPYITFGEAVEALVAFSFDLHREEILTGVKNYALTTEDFVIAWESEELIDDLWYKIIQVLKRRIVISRTFNEPIDE